MDFFALAPKHLTNSNKSGRTGRSKIGNTLKMCIMPFRESYCLTSVEGIFWSENNNRAKNKSFVSNSFVHLQHAFHLWV